MIRFLAALVTSGMLLGSTAMAAATKATPPPIKPNSINYNASKSNTGNSRATLAPIATPAPTHKPHSINYNSSKSNTGNIRATMAPIVTASTAPGSAGAAPRPHPTRRPH